MKVAFLIPSTTRKRPWEKMEDTYLYTIFGKSFIRTVSDDIEYTIYIYIDTDDPIYSKTMEINKFKSLIGEKAKNYIHFRWTNFKGTFNANVELFI